MRDWQSREAGRQDNLSQEGKSRNRSCNSTPKQGSGRDRNEWRRSDESFYLASVSYESVNTLRRHREIIEKDVAERDSILAVGSSRGEQKFMVQETEGDITKLEDQMGEALELYSQQIRARAEQQSSGEEGKCDNICEKWHDWVLMARQRNIEKQKKGAGARGGVNAVMMEWI